MAPISTPRFRHLLRRLVPLLALVAVAAFSGAAHATSIIRHPGLHPSYDFELEPHLVVAWDNAPWGDTGLGLGMQMAIPLMHNGPIDKINNNMAIGFGLNWVNYSDCNDQWGPNNNNTYDCSVNGIHIPIVLQWNFYLTDIITVYGEPGIGIRHVWGSWEWPCNGGDRCEDDDSDTDPIPVFGGGAKFMFGRTAGLNIRISYPILTVGASFLL